jgi:Asp-tRNA(Asn)/Glu-tRNA(Gln) amidotransferase A subunit family amidase
MGSDELALMSAVELAAGYRARRFSPVEVTEAVLARVARVNPRLNAFCVVTGEAARREAKQAEDAMARGERLSPLRGVPLSVKDMVTTKGVRTTFGSAIYADHVPAEDAPMVESLKRAGAIVIGKTTTPVRCSAFPGTRGGSTARRAAPVAGRPRPPPPAAARCTRAATAAGRSGSPAASVASTG